MRYNCELPLVFREAKGKFTPGTGLTISKAVLASFTGSIPRDPTVKSFPEFGPSGVVAPNDPCRTRTFAAVSVSYRVVLVVPKKLLRKAAPPAFGLRPKPGS